MKDTSYVALCRFVLIVAGNELQGLVCQDGSLLHLAM